MTPKEFADKIRATFPPNPSLNSTWTTPDPEDAHRDADYLMEELLISLGYEEGVVVSGTGVYASEGVGRRAQLCTECLMTYQMEGDSLTYTVSRLVDEEYRSDASDTAYCHAAGLPFA